MKIDWDADVQLGDRKVVSADILLQIKYVRENLSYAQVFKHYGLPWVSDSTHQLSCVFHAKNVDSRGVPYEQNPSARYYEDDKRIWCFACSDGGDVVWFVRRRENLKTLHDSLEFIAHVFGIGINMQDLSRRIAVHRQLREQEKPKRDVASQLYSNKINDALYKIKQTDSRLEETIDRLSNSLFKRKAQLDNLGNDLDYFAYVASLRLWHRDSLDMIRAAVLQWQQENKG